jgi:hypothetical protein
LKKRLVVEIQREGAVVDGAPGVGEPLEVEICNFCSTWLRRPEAGRRRASVMATRWILDLDGVKM